MSFSDMFKVYPNRNSELQSLAHRAFEYARTMAREQSSALSSGLDTHAIARQRSYVAAMTASVESLAASPTLDLPASHPISFDINLTPEFETFISGFQGTTVPINHDARRVVNYWMQMAVEMAKSQSAALGGSIIGPDHTRMTQNIQAITRVLQEIEDRPPVDLPETSEPGSAVGPTG